MLNAIPEKILKRMRYLETKDAEDRVDGTARMKRLRQIPPESGRFLALTALMAPQGEMVEIGTSAGYSALWLSLAAVKRKGKITTFEILPAKAELARKTFKEAGVEKLVELIEDDALNHLGKIGNIAYCFLDAEKEVYEKCIELVIPNLVPGGIIIADNIISHKAELKSFTEMMTNDERLDTIIVTIGKGLLLSRRTD